MSEVARTFRMTDNLGLGKSLAKESPLATLIERAKAGDHTAFDQIMICYQHKVVSTAWRMLGNQEDARDAAQEAFLRVYRYLKSFRQDEDFAAWLHRIVVNVCRDMAKKRSRNQSFASYEADNEAEEIQSLRSADDVEAEAIKSQEKAIIARALETLSVKERQALVLRDLEGLATEEVAQILGSSQTTVRSQISSARAKIKRFRDRTLERRRQE